MALAAASAGKAQLVVKVDKGLVARGLSAKEIANAGARILGGGGGGREDMAVAGGGNVDGIDGALAEVESAVVRALGGAS